MGESTLGWGRRQLNELVDRRTDRSSDPTDRVLTISAAQGLVDQADYFSRVVASKDLSTYYTLRRGDFAYNKSYSVGYPVGVIRRLDRYDDGVVSPLYICFRPRPGVVDANFLEQLLRAGRLDEGIAWIAKEGARNHGLLNVRSGDFFGLEIDVPPLEEQRRIAEILDTIDETIRASERVIAKLRQVDVALARELIASIPPQSFQELGAIAKSSVDGPFGSALKSSDYVDFEGVRVVRLGNLGDGYFNDSDSVYIDSGYAAKLIRHNVTHGDLLVASLGDENHRPGRACLYPASGEPGIVKADCFRFRFDHSTVSPEFLMHRINAPDLAKAVRRKSGGVTRDRVNLSTIRQLVVPLPSIDDQQDMAAVLRSSREVIASEVERLSKLSAIRSGVAADLLSGRVRTVAA
jgi:type I restriction enzyme S subunit